MVIDEEARDLAVLAAGFADDLKASDILVLHVGDVLSLTEYFVVVTASNRRQVDALVNDIEAKVRDASDRSPVRVEGAKELQWVLIDYGDVIVHVFLDEVRRFYEIERLYNDVPKVKWDDGRPGADDSLPDAGSG